MYEMIKSLSKSDNFIVALAIAILIVTMIVSHFAVKLTRTLLSSNGRPVPKHSIVENIVLGVIWVIGGSLILAYCFDVDVDGLIAALGVGGIALSIGFQDTLANIIGGVQITWLGIIAPGDHVVINSCEGIVENVNWRHTTVMDFERVVHVIPNSQINSSGVDKYEPANLVTTAISFTNDSDDLTESIATVERLTKEAVSEVAELERDPWVLLTDVGEYGTHANLRFVLKDMDKVREARDAAMRAISPYTRPRP